MFEPLRGCSLWVEEHLCIEMASQHYKLDSVMTCSHSHTHTCTYIHTHTCLHYAGWKWHPRVSFTHLISLSRIYPRYMSAWSHLTRVYVYSQSIYLCVDIHLTYFHHVTLKRQSSAVCSSLCILCCLCVFVYSMLCLLPQVGKTAGRHHLS